ncbi:MAG: hypothetical protein PWQ37_963 [Candidatus Petromonas sp.]|nr:hypothetical protein [Candidatus Petromonas sp.]
MLVARKKHYYDTNEINRVYEDNYRNTNKKNTVRKNRKSNHRLAISVIICVMMISGSLIFLLSRYTAITETKYRIITLNKQADELESQLQDLNAQLDSLTRSDIIEKKAIEKLDMQYPKYEQMVFLNLENDYDLELSNAEDNLSPEKQIPDKNMYYYLKSSLQKMYSLLD